MTNFLKTLNTKPKPNLQTTFREHLTLLSESNNKRQRENHTLL